MVIDSNGTAAHEFTLPVGLAANTWVYVAVSRDTSGFIQVWVANEGDASAAASASGRFDSTVNVGWTLTGLSNTIGAFVPAGRQTRAFVSNVRVTTTNEFATTDTTIAIPTARFEEIPGTVLLINNDTLVDETGNNTLVAISDAVGSTFNPF
jgi:hypothetical protein